MELNIWIAFGAGIASFISPCCLPLYPSYLSYITGISVNDLKTGQTKEMRMKTMSHTLFFILGFSVVYYVLGAAAGLIGELFIQYNDLISKLAGILIILMGLMLLGIFKPQLLMRDIKLKLPMKPVGYIGSFLIGIGFAAGWSPCVGPILSAIIALASSEPESWFALITSYSLGFAVPFFVMAFFIGSTKWILKYTGIIMKAGGVLMILLGIFLYTGTMSQITSKLNSITPDFLKF